MEGLPALCREKGARDGTLKKSTTNRKKSGRAVSHFFFFTITSFFLCAIHLQEPGRAALLGAALGCSLGVHACGFIGLSWWQCWMASGSSSSSSPRLLLAWQWCAYATAVSTFHLSEYFTTALFNPTAANSDSFLVNHSTGYTTAALTSWTEFGLRFLFLPQWNLPRYLVFLGLLVVVLAQTIRSAAMMTAAESFNHLIQTHKKENHVLITHGIYSILRHPSYVGFYYWSIGTQLLLGNTIHALMFAIVSWSFFKRRIPFEEESLCVLFPDEYPPYVAKTWMGIPFLYTQVAAVKSTISSTNTKDD